MIAAPLPILVARRHGGQQPKGTSPARRRDRDGKKKNQTRIRSSLRVTQGDRQREVSRAKKEKKASANEEATTTTTTRCQGEFMARAATTATTHPMDSEGSLGPELLVDDHRLCGGAVLLLHEPRRLVCPYRNCSCTHTNGTRAMALEKLGGWG